MHFCELLEELRYEYMCVYVDSIICIYLKQMYAHSIFTSILIYMYIHVDVYEFIPMFPISIQDHVSKSLLQE